MHDGETPLRAALAASNGKKDGHQRLLARLRYQVDFAAMSSRNPARNAQAQAGSLDFAACCVSSEKWIENAFQRFRLNPGARIADPHLRLAVHALQFQAHLPQALIVFDGI